jgi:hypothetical protein
MTTYTNLNSTLTDLDDLGIGRLPYSSNDYTLLYRLLSGTDVKLEVNPVSGACLSMAEKRPNKPRHSGSTKPEVRYFTQAQNLVRKAENLVMLVLTTASPD